MPTTRPLPVLRPDRIRLMPRSFAWLDHRLRTDGFLPRMTVDETGLYSFLALASDAKGLSCWRLDRMERELATDVSALMRARDGLLRSDLLAFHPWSESCPDGSYQLLSLPHVPPPAPRGATMSIGQVLLNLDGVCR